MKLLFRIISFFLLLWLTTTYAEVRIEITHGNNEAMPVAVVPFSWSGTGMPPADIGAIIADDLRNSGQFNPLDPNLLPQKPVRAVDITPSLWQTLGISYIIVGNIQPGASGHYLVSYQLVNISAGADTVLSQAEFNATGPEFRYVAHTASDQIYAKLTGIRGAFRTRIAFVARTEDPRFPYEIRISDYDGYNSSVVRRSSEPLMSPAWSPDGRKLAYVTFENRHAELVMQTLSDGTVKTLASFPGHNGSPAFSPDGKKMAFALSMTGSLNIYVMDLVSGKIDPLTHNRSNNTEPAWFPDSRTLAFTSDEAGRPQIYTLSLQGGVTQRLSWQGQQNQDACVSPDGKYLVMVGTQNGGQHIVRLDLKTNETRVMTDTLLDETPSIAPNGSMIMYSSAQGQGSVLRLISADGRFRAMLPAGDAQLSSPAWSPYL